MKSQQPEAPAVSPYRRPLTMLMLSALIAAGGWYASMFWVDELDQAYNSQKASLDAARRKYRSAIEDVEIAATYLDRYNAFAAENLLGPANRLGWSDTLQTLGKEMALVDISLEVSQDEAMDAKLRSQFSATQNIYHSANLTMRFTAQHEGDLLRVLARVSEEVSPMYLLQDCTLTRVATDELPSYSTQGNVEVNCTLQLIQINPRERS